MQEDIGSHIASPAPGVNTVLVQSERRQMRIRIVYIDVGVLNNLLKDSSPMHKPTCTTMQPQRQA